MEKINNQVFDKEKAEMCLDHPNQKLILVCLEDQRKLCPKCVTKHGGHTIYDFEDFCRIKILPNITSNEDSNSLKLTRLYEDLDEILARQRELKETAEGQDRIIQQLNEGIVKELVVQMLKLQSRVKEVVEDTNHIVQTNVAAIQDKGQQLMKESQTLSKIFNLFDKEDFSSIIEEFMEMNQPQQRSQESRLDLDTIYSLNSKAVRAVVNAKKELAKCNIANSDKLQADLRALIKAHISEEQACQMPQLFYIHEKQKTFKYYDLDQHQFHTRDIEYESSIPMFAGIGSVQRRIFLFGGTVRDTKEITNKAFELLRSIDDNFKMVRVNRMFKNRSRAAVASVDSQIQAFNPFLVIIGGSDQQLGLKTCELYCPQNDCYYYFPPLNIARENASVCVMENCAQSGYTYIYVFGGFDKTSVSQIERVKIAFEADQKQPNVHTQWEALIKVSMVKSVESCGVFQSSPSEMLIFGGFQMGKDKNTQLMVFDVDKQSLSTVNSHMQYTACFMLAPVKVYNNRNFENVTPMGNGDIEEKISDTQDLQGSQKRHCRMYAWSIYDNLHMLDLDTLKWQVIIEEDGDSQPQSLL